MPEENQASKLASNQFDVMQDLRDEVRSLRGLVEELSYDLQKMKQRQLDDYLELDCYIGVTGWICDEKRNVELRKTIKNIPLSKLMIETDCPYLIPKNLLDKPKNNRNEPSYLNHIVTEISILLDTDEEDIRNESFKNTLSFFQGVN